MSDFKPFSQLVTSAFNSMTEHDSKSDRMFYVDISGDDLYAHYLASFPEGTNPIFRERTEHDCSCCKNFIRNIGAVVLIENDKTIRTVWDSVNKNNVDYPYDVVANAMADMVRSKAIKGAFIVSEPAYGAVTTNSNGEVWNHFYASVPKNYLEKHNTSNTVGERNTDYEILKRTMKEITDDSVEMVLELIDQNSLYRGKENRAAVALVQTLKRAYDKLKTDGQRELWLRINAKPNTRVRNTMIGTLLIDLSSGDDLEVAVKKYEDKASGTNYRRPTALVTQKMIDSAKKTVEDLGIEDSLHRRFATKADISVNDVLFVDGKVRQKLLGGAFDTVKPTKTQTVPKFDNVEKIHVDAFIKNVLPKANEIELFVKNSLAQNFASLIAPVHKEAASLFKWDNGFSWSYAGELADSDIRRQVQAKGGRVDGVLRFSHSWNYDARNASLMDLHVFMPGCNHKSGINNDYGTGGQRVGWNNRSDRISGGVQDVDYTDAAPEGYVPVENITFPDLSRLKNGDYHCKIHNWAFRAPTKGGFKAEIEFEGQIFEYEYTKPLKNHEWVDVATITLKDGKFSIKHHLTPGLQSKKVWGVDTETWVPVELITKSPNAWGDKVNGNEHLFFMLKGCLNPGDTRGFYNEFLRDDLNKHRKVFELLAKNLKAPYTVDQLSGIGISTTKKESVLLRVKGSINRVLEVTF